eukprot:snap_masked-scaffold1782_size28275-processed-gene-0.3 protein:Tk08659 transcript:snap_masked-scaffold1782_size28275-processed-gene-0.3-mRNA-1 annotation:"hypothetical protein ETSY2_36450"
MGMVNQLGAFMPDMSPMMCRMRGLLKKGIAWLWLGEHQREMEKIKAALTSPLLIKPSDPRLKTVLLTDASRFYGLGFALMQESLPGRRDKLVLCGSCSISDAQRRYTTIELECLGMEWAVPQCKFYLQGLPDFVVLTDHKPLVGTFLKDMHAIENPGLQRMRERLTAYSFTVSWVLGKHHMIADALSRSPVFALESDFLHKDDATRTFPSHG